MTGLPLELMDVSNSVTLKYGGKVSVSRSEIDGLAWVLTRYKFILVIFSNVGIGLSALQLKRKHQLL